VPGRHGMPGSLKEGSTTLFPVRLGSFNKMRLEGHGTPLHPLAWWGWSPQGNLAMDEAHVGSFLFSWGC